MPDNKAKSAEIVASSVAFSNGATTQVGAQGQYLFECFDSEGNLKWSDTADNIVVSVGAQFMNQRFFAGSSYTATWYIGLINGATAPSYNSADTMSSHAGWTEVTNYSNATRPACSFGTATTASPSVISNSGSVAVFNMSGTATVAGAFLVSDSTKSGTTGTLFSEANFTGGNRSVGSGDTLQVTYTFTLTPT
jgi:hypothetical protein